MPPNDDITIILPKY